jgi:hypothetical protein
MLAQRVIFRDHGVLEILHRIEHAYPPHYRSGFVIGDGGKGVYLDQVELFNCGKEIAPYKKLFAQLKAVRIILHGLPKGLFQS